MCKVHAAANSEMSTGLSCKVKGLGPGSGMDSSPGVLNGRSQFWALMTCTLQAGHVLFTQVTAVLLTYPAYMPNSSMG